jgi:magnesium-transporting ATPase (P-type)
METNPNSRDPADGRKSYEWASRWDAVALKEIYWETAYIFFILFISLFLIFATWKGWMCLWLSSQENEAIVLKIYAYFAFSGMLGGITFGMKHFYRMVARGGWHQDRRIWRIMSPFIAMVIAIIIGAMLDIGIIPYKKPLTGATIMVIGFLAGYFADEAVGKMYEIAKVIFGDSALSRAKTKDEKAGDGK